jgi:hypothetical protein
MKPEDFSRGAKNLVCVCIDRRAGCCFAGRMYHRFSLQAQAFCEPNQLLMQMDALFDRLNYPQRTMAERTFQAKSRSQQDRKEGKAMPKEEWEVVGNPAEQKGELATFVIHVMYRQNATWQGSVLWAESGQTQNFRSALELIKLMDSAMEEEGPAIEERAGEK